MKRQFRLAAIAFTGFSMLSVHAFGVAVHCTADLNSDGVIDITDLARLLAHFGTMVGGTWENGDLDADGTVDIADLSRLLRSFGENCSQFQDGNYCTASGRTIYEYYPDGVLRRSADGYAVPEDAQLVVWGFTPDRRLIATTDTPSTATESILEIGSRLDVVVSYTLSAGDSANAWITQAAVNPDDSYLYAVRFHSFSPDGPNIVEVFDRSQPEQSIASFPTTSEEGVGIAFHEGLIYVSGWSSTMIGQYQSSAPYGQIDRCAIEAPQGTSCGKLLARPHGNLFVVIYAGGPDYVQEFEPICGGVRTYAYGTHQGWNIDFNPDGQLVVCGSHEATAVFETYTLGESTPAATVELSPQVMAPQGLAVVPASR